MTFPAGFDAKTAAADWVAKFNAAAMAQDAKAATVLFAKECHWRDLVAFTWHLLTFNGADAIEGALSTSLPAIRPTNFRLAEERTPPRIVVRAGQETIEAIFAFETFAGRGNGIVRLVEDPGGALRAWVLLTALDDLKNHEAKVGANRPGGQAYSREFGGPNWMDFREKAQAYEDHDPAVIVIGGGQAGLGIAACLGQIGVDAMVIDVHERIGDAWRKRYHSLTLHNEVYINHLPYMKFPDNWPVFIPKDKLANWFEIYAEAMELNVWTGTHLTDGSYDEHAGHWNVTLRRGDGTERKLRPRHLVFATGLSGIPVRPDIPGLADFKGDVLHSKEYSEGHTWKGKKALVMGTGNSGHDVAQDLHAAGADVTMIQRSSTLIVSLEQAQRVYDMYSEGPPIEDCDLIATASPYPVLVQGYQIAAQKMKEADQELLDGLEKKGFRLDYGPPDNTGYQMKYLRRGGGYYFNVGCSDLIVSGDIDLINYDQIDHFEADGARLKDGSLLQADVLVTATGYKNQQEDIRQLLGDEIADRIGRVWGFDDGGEQQNMWRRTNQPGLWFTAGGLPHVRIYSPYLALQIKAAEEGYIEPTRQDVSPEGALASPAMADA